MPVERWKFGLEHLPAESRALLGSFESHYSTRGLLHSDPPDHTRLRRLVLRAFTPPVIESLRPFIQETVDELLDAGAERGELDIIEDLAFALPVAVLANVMGVPRSDAPLFRRWADGILGFQGVNRPDLAALLGAQEAIVEARAYLTDLIAAKRRSPDDSLLGRLVEAEAEGDALSLDELLNTCVTLLGAGHETATSLIVRISLNWPCQSARNGHPGSGFWPPPRRPRQRPTRGVALIP